LSLVPLPLLFIELHSSCDINNALKSYTNPHVLVIDEMGYLGYGPDAADILFQVVNLRYTRKVSYPVHNQQIPEAMGPSSS